MTYRTPVARSNNLQNSCLTRLPSLTCYPSFCAHFAPKFFSSLARFACDRQMAKKIG